MNTATGKPGGVLYRIPLRNAAIGSALAVLMFITLYYLEKSPLVNTKFFNTLLLLIFLVFTLREYKEQHAVLKFWQGMSLGFLFYLPFALVSGTAVYIALTSADPGLLDGYVDQRIAELELNREQIVKTIDRRSFEEALESIRGTTPIQLALDDFLKNTIAGLFITILVSVIFKNRKPLTQ
jgi:hypothetical protein